MSLGDLYAEKDLSADAISSYERALKAAGYDTEAPPTDSGRTFVMTIFEKMIKLYSIANRPDDVRATIERARKLFGKQDLFADRQLISYYREKGDRESALAAIRAVRERLPNDETFLRLEAAVLAESGQIDEAVRIFRGEKQRMVKAAEASTAFFNGADKYSDAIYISNLYSEAGRPKEAAAAANEAYGLAVGVERKQIAKLTLASAQQKAGDFDAAEATLRAILKESPNNPIASNNLGYFFLERGIKFEEALELIKAAVDIDPTNPSFLDSLGWAYFKLGNIAEAEKHLRAALRYDPSSATINEHLGDVLLKAGRQDDAKQSWEKARMLASAPDDLSRISEKIAGIGK
jgi:tetratricopeptide (TPR) repeat protein